jgi:rubrerythrin
MKTLFRLTLLLLTVGLFFGSCKNQTAKKEHAMEHNKEHKADDKMNNKAYTSAYVCPMHCDGSGDEQPGKCPVCGMEYVKNENHPEPHQ